MGLFGHGKSKQEKDAEYEQLRREHLLAKGLSLYEDRQWKKALETLTPLAEEGIVQAQYLCACMYDNSVRQRDSDRANALFWYSRAAQQGHPEAQYEYGASLVYGKGCEADTEAGLAYLRQAAQQGLAKAQLEYGYLLAWGKNITPDKEQALFWNEKAARQGIAKAQHNCGLLCSRGEGTEKNLPAALDWFLQAAQQGFPESQYQCGRFYRNGLGTTPDLTQALTWYLKAATQGYAPAQYAAGFMYSQQNDDTAAASWYKRAADQGYVPAMERLAELFFRDGLCLDEPLLQALAYAQQAAAAGSQRGQALAEKIQAEQATRARLAQTHAPFAREEDAQQGDLAAQLRYAQRLEADGDTDQALAWYEKAAQQDNAPAQAACARLYTDPQTSWHDPDKALAWADKYALHGEKDTTLALYKALAEQQLPAAMVHYGQLLEQMGEDSAATRLYLEAGNLDYPEGLYRAGCLIQKTGPDPLRLLAKKLLATAAEQKHVGAHYALADILMNENPPNDQIACDLMAVAYSLEKTKDIVPRMKALADKGVAAAQVEYGKLLSDGQVIAQDYTQARLWFLKAADSGSTEGMFWYGALHWFGDGVPQSTSRAAEWFRRAAELGHAPSQTFYGKCKQACGDMDEAILWWERAAQQGHPEAQYLCGLYYHDTAGHKDPERARYWLDKAAQQGHPEAIRMKEEYGYC